MAGTAAQVAESAAIATAFQIRLFNEDTRTAIDARTNFLNESDDLVREVQNYRGTQLWQFVWDRVQEKQNAQQKLKQDPRKQPSPNEVRFGYELIMAAAFKDRWLPPKHEGSSEAVEEGQAVASAALQPMEREEEEQPRETTKNEKDAKQEEEEQVAETTSGPSDAKLERADPESHGVAKVRITMQLALDESARDAVEEGQK